MLKQFIKDYFSFNRGERNGILILLAIILIIVTYLNIEDLFINKQHVDFSEFEKEIDLFLADQKEKPRFNRSAATNLFKEKDTLNFASNLPHAGTAERWFKEEPAEMFYFDPNNLTDEQWKQLGLKDWQIKAINKYLLKAESFRSKEDFKKLRVISKEQYQLLEPYISLPKETSENNNETRQGFFPDAQYAKLSDKSAGHIELNTANKEELMQLKGIGPVYSRQIIKYRDLLGGYLKKEQLLEVYGINDSLLEQISIYMEIDLKKIKKINVNYCSIYQLSKHPYVIWNVANAIVNYRDRHGQYTNLRDIQKTDLINEGLFLKIAPYLTIE